ncbi:C-type lectin domain family 6 member A-like [Channa argus]|uniref:C-type lectin domain family 6 member A-like n=1 Tax=Channa argus TaxID=215402 RepID=UPI0035218056
MSSDIIYAKPDFSKVRYNRKVEEDGGEWEEREVDIYENADVIRDDGTDIQSQEEGRHTLNRPPVQNKSFRSAALCLAVLCLLLMVGIITLSTQLTLEKNYLEKNLNNLTKSYNELQDKMSDTSFTNSQLQDEIKQLTDKIQGKICPEGWKRFGCSCYFKSSEKKSWSESRKDCENRESDLVIINSKEEQKMVSELTKNGESWIGLRTEQPDSGGKYQGKWVDGSTLTQDFWASGEPQDTGYLYAAYCDQHGRWRSERDNYSKNWICEKKISCFL